LSFTTTDVSLCLLNQIHSNVVIFFQMRWLNYLT